MKKISGIIISLVLIIGFLFVLTEYSGIPSAKDALSRVLSSTAGLSSVEYEINRTTIISNREIPALKEEIKTYAQEIIGTDNFHLEAEIFADGERARGFSLYTEKANDGITVYLCENDNWFKIRSKLSLSELGLGIDSFATIIDILEMTEAQTIAKEEKDGEDVIVISGKIKDENTEDTFSSLRREDIEAFIGIFGDINPDDIFGNLAPATIEITADADSFRLIEIKLDATAAAQSAYNNFINATGYGESGFDITVGKEKTEVKMKSHNNINSIKIPDEAKDAQEFPAA